MEDTPKWEIELLAQISEMSNAELFEQTLEEREPDSWDGCFTDRQTKRSRIFTTALTNRLEEFGWLDAGENFYQDAQRLAELVLRLLDGAENLSDYTKATIPIRTLAEKLAPQPPAGQAPTPPSGLCSECGGAEWTHSIRDHEFTTQAPDDTGGGPKL